MSCPKCGSTVTIKYGGVIRRGGVVPQRRCKTCGHTYTTKEDKKNE